jgi:YHS domain-containing protein
VNVRSITQGVLLAGITVAAVVGVRFAAADDGHSHHNHGKATKPAAKAENKQKIKGAAYSLDTCPVTGEKLGSMGEPVVYNHNGREIKFCCAGCIEEFEANADKYIAEIDKQIIAQQLKNYPLTTCVVTDEPLGSMGETIDYVWNNRLVRFCCEGCIDAFEEDPAPFIAKIDKAAKAKASKSPAQGS